MHCRMFADMSWFSCVSRCFLASILPTRATVLREAQPHLRSETHCLVQAKRCSSRNFLQGRGPTFCIAACSVTQPNKFHAKSNLHASIEPGKLPRQAHLAEGSSSPSSVTSFSKLSANAFISLTAFSLSFCTPSKSLCMHRINFCVEASTAVPF